MRSGLVLQQVRPDEKQNAPTDTSRTPDKRAFGQRESATPTKRQFEFSVTATPMTFLRAETG
ncbi:MAG: hypothetical protein CL535_12410 [Ahrensia sp.]|nr:hypothetical protein [Ahrensia sp.]